MGLAASKRQLFFETCYIGEVAALFSKRRFLSGRECRIVKRLSNLKRDEAAARLGPQKVLYIASNIAGPWASAPAGDRLQEPRPRMLSGALIATISISTPEPSGLFQSPRTKPRAAARKRDAAGTDDSQALTK